MYCFPAINSLLIPQIFAKRIKTIARLPLADNRAVWLRQNKVKNQPVLIHVAYRKPHTF